MSPRPARSQLSTYTYFHVCARGNGGQDIFLEDADKIRYLNLTEKYRARYGLNCFAYCLMTNHVHWLFRAPSIATLSKAMHGLHVAYVMAFNRRHQRNGHLFQDRFSSWVIEHEGHLTATKEYIESNPVRAKLVARNEEYQWSSAWGDGSVVTLNVIGG